MQGPNPKILKWKGVGRTYDGQTISTAEIPIMEKRGISMEGIDKFSVPINAKLAVHLISKLWSTIKEQQYTNEAADGKETAKTAIINRIKDEAECGNKPSFLQVMNELQTMLNESDYWFDELLMSCFAITFDRSLLLKLLSQPDCEGVRFYLCMREEADQDVKVNHGVLSFVTVGVDKEGKDLDYEYTQSTHKLSNVETSSLTAEYGYSAQMLCFSATDQRLDPYVLFKYALPTTSIP